MPRRSVTQGIFLLLLLGFAATATAEPFYTLGRSATCYLEGVTIQSNSSCQISGGTDGGFVNAGLSYDGPFLNPPIPYAGQAFSEFDGFVAGGTSVIVPRDTDPGPNDVRITGGAWVYLNLKFYFRTEGPVRPGVVRYRTNSFSSFPGSTYTELNIAPEAMSGPVGPVFYLGIPFSIEMELIGFNPNVSSATFGLSDFRLYEADGVTPVPFFGSPVPEPSMLLPVGVLLGIAGVRRYRRSSHA